MKKTSLKAILTLSIIAALFLFVLAGCGQNVENTSGNMGTAGESTRNSGTLILSVNPEIEITYNGEGIVTSVTACNDDALAILSAYSGFEGKECREVVTELVTEIGKAGYLIEEIEGEACAITIEIEEGSMLPTDSFMEDIASDVKDCVSDNEWNGSVEIIGDSNYGVSDYDDTGDSNYGDSNYGDSSYDDTDNSNYGDSSYDDTDNSNYGDSSYDDTDDSNYGDSSYDDTDDSNYGDSTYDDTNDSNYGDSTYDDTNDSNYGDSAYDDTDDSNYGDSSYDNTSDSNYGTTPPAGTDSDSGYDDSDDGDSDYDDSDDGDSDYDDSDDGDSDYDDSDYDDSDDGDSDYDD